MLPQSRQWFLPLAPLGRWCPQALLWYAVEAMPEFLNNLWTNTTLAFRRASREKGWAAIIYCLKVIEASGAPA